MTLLKRFLRPKLVAVLVIASLQQNASAADVILHHSQVFLNSLYTVARVQAPRIGLAALHTYLALPSLLQEWHIVSSDAAAAYNSLTNTLVLQREMMIEDPDFHGMRLPALPEIHAAVGGPARVTAGIIFHELSHAEFDFYVEEGEEEYDRVLMSAIRAEMPAIVANNSVSVFKSVALPSEIFAYYREELLGRILEDVAEIKLASGIDPDLNTCTKIRTRPDVMRNFSPNNQPYSKRVHLTGAYVAGDFIALDFDPELNQRLNAALFAHTIATMRFPESRAELLKALQRDPSLRLAIAKCRDVGPLP